MKNKFQIFKTLISGKVIHRFSLIGGYWSRRHIHAVYFSGFSAMLDLYMGGWSDIH